MFWLARYIERAEDTARILDVTYHALLEQAQHPYRLRWDALIAMAGEESRFRQLHREASAQSVFEFLAFNHDNPSSIVQCITKARENARTIRDRISREMWEDINGLYLTRDRLQRQPSRSPSDLIASARKSSSGAIVSTASPTQLCRTMRAGSFCALDGRSNARR